MHQVFDIGVVSHHANQEALDVGCIAIEEPRLCVDVVGAEGGHDRDVARARAIAPHVDALLLDTGNPDAARKELGGTGRTHDWSLSREVVANVDVPVLLAGGLTPENVGLAIQTVRPWAVDLCNGVRTDRRLDEAKLAAFMRSVRSAQTSA